MNQHRVRKNLPHPNLLNPGMRLYSSGHLRQLHGEEIRHLFHPSQGENGLFGNLSISLDVDLFHPKELLLQKMRIDAVDRKQGKGEEKKQKSHTDCFSQDGLKFFCSLFFLSSPRTQEFFPSYRNRFSHLFVPMRRKAKGVR